MPGRVHIWEANIPNQTQLEISQMKSDADLKKLVTFSNPEYRNNSGIEKSSIGG